MYLLCKIRLSLENAPGLFKLAAQNIASRKLGEGQGPKR